MLGILESACQERKAGLIRKELSKIYRVPRFTERKIFLVENDRYVISINLFATGNGFDWSMLCKLSGYSLAYRGYWSYDGGRVRSNAHASAPDDGTNFIDTHCMAIVEKRRSAILRRIRCDNFLWSAPVNRTVYCIVYLVPHICYYEQIRAVGAPTA